MGIRPFTSRNNHQKKEEMKEKLRAIWMILFAQKIAVFTWKEGTPDELNTPATFAYVLSHNWKFIGLRYIKQTVEKILNGEIK